MNKRLIAYVDYLKPDVIFTQHNDAGDVTFDTLRELNKRTKCLINWTGDIVYPRPKWYDEIQASCISCYSNMDDVKIAKANGHRSYFFNHFNENQYNKQGLLKKYDIVFLGSHYDRYPLSAYRMEMVDFLFQNFGDKFHLFGNSWGKRPHRFVSRGESNTIYNEAKIAINCSQVEAERYTSDRLMHIMASGCFCLCKYYPGAEIDLGADGECVRYFHNNLELKELCEYYLLHDKEREEIAARGYERVFKSFGDNCLKDKINEIYLDTIEIYGITADKQL